MLLQFFFFFFSGSTITGKEGEGKEGQGLLPNYGSRLRPLSTGPLVFGRTVPSPLHSGLKNDRSKSLTWFWLSVENSTVFLFRDEKTSVEFTIRQRTSTCIRIYCLVCSEVSCPETGIRLCIHRRHRRCSKDRRRRSEKGGLRR